MQYQHFYPPDTDSPKQSEAMLESSGSNQVLTSRREELEAQIIDSVFCYEIDVHGLLSHISQPSLCK